MHRARHGRRGIGFVRSGLRSKPGGHGVGLEPNQKMVDFAVNTLGLDVRQGSLERFDTDRQFAAVTMILRCCLTSSILITRSRARQR